MERNEKFWKKNLNDSLSHILTLKMLQITRLITILPSLIKNNSRLNGPFCLFSILKLSEKIPSPHEYKPFPFYSLLAIEIHGDEMLQKSQKYNPSLCSFI